MEFLSIFLRAASPRLMPQTSDNLIRYKRTSDNSSPRCSLSDSSQFVNPFSTSPFHWNISDSSPTSPICRERDRERVSHWKINKNHNFICLYLFFFICHLTITYLAKKRASWNPKKTPQTSWQNRPFMSYSCLSKCLNRKILCFLSTRVFVPIYFKFSLEE